MDGLTKDTVILLKENEYFQILRIDENVDEDDWYVNNNIVSSWEYKTLLIVITSRYGQVMVGKKLKKRVKQKIEKYFIE